ncbi:MAG: T9SS type A sorting domain-containing protein [Bacteroidota bacterium]
MNNKERNTYTVIITAVAIITITASGLYWGFDWKSQSEGVAENNALDPVEKKRARTDYFFNLLRDPGTNSIPANIRSRELNHAKQLPGRGGGLLRKSGQAAMQEVGDISWHLAGPEDLGGRTRALAFDQENPENILAGGVSGGIWKSTDGGDTWQMKTDPNQNMSVTSLAQDPTNPDTWYYASGEFFGNSASDRGSTASYFGTGIYKSTDNGETWSRLASTEDTDIDWNSEFDFISRIVVNPQNGDVYFAANGDGIYRSADGGTSFNRVLGSLGGYRFADVIVNENGDLLAALSQNSAGDSQPEDPGIYRSTDDGSSWTDVTPSDFPSSHDRTYLAFAPSAPDTAYAFTYEGSGSGDSEDISFFMLDLNDNSSEDRSDNLPDFGGSVGFVNTQGNYNMALAVKPDDPDVVLLGATNLFRSTDGFATTPDGGYDNTDEEQKDEYWIGGYAKANNVSQYANQHPDQHVLVFHPDDPNILWAGHDGGLSRTTDISAEPVNWEDTDQGYVTGQFYTVAIPVAEDDERIMGGTQDNGTPFYRFSSDNEQITEQLDVSSGDGSYAFWGTDYAYVSSQNGSVMRLGIESDGDLTSAFDGATATDYQDVTPSGASNQLFVHPYAIDPNDEGIMYYPGGITMWRNTEVDGESVGSNWEDFDAASSGTITALEVTNSAPQDRLYYATSSDQAPSLFMVDEASSVDEWSKTDISIGDAEPGAYVHDIAVNPNDGNELVVVMSNYNIEGLYYSDDAGSSWTLIEGNLKDDSQNPGPSLRNATILPTQAGNLYLVGTSTGVYSTMSLDGDNTSWERESDDGSPESIGYSVAEFITSRPADGTIAVGTHGRGIFVGRTDVGDVSDSPDQPLPTVEHTLDVNDSWQLVGSPMTSGSGVELGNDLQLFSFSGSYRSASSVEPHNGYWTKSRDGSEIMYDGSADTTASIALDEGWNLIGGVADTTATANIDDPDGIRSAAPVYEYTDGAYQEASDVKSLQGYWIHADEAGDIELNWDGSSERGTAAMEADNLINMTFSSSQSSQQFFIADRQLDNAERNRFLMPPEAPDPVLDVRTNDGLKVAEGNQAVLNLTSSDYPVTVNISDAPETVALQGIMDQDTTYYHFEGEESVSLQHEYEKLVVQLDASGLQVEGHDLLPNYPNPFNTETQIRYQVASQEHVTLEVFDILGRKVQTLVDEQKMSGSYTVQFDGSNLSSGMYFARLQVGETVQMQKMTLIK